MYLKKLLKNKRGISGFFSGAVEGITSFIQSAIAIIPKPMLFLIFIFVLVGLASLLSLIFNAFGTYCNSANLPVTLDGGLFAGVTLIGQTPDTKFLDQSVITDADNFQHTTSECIIQVTNATATFNNGQKTQVIDRKVYRDQGCLSCQQSAFITESRTGLDINGKYCLDNIVTKKDDDDKSLLERTFCGAKILGRCEPPEHYYWNSNSNEYVCADETCATTTLGRKWDETLASKGAKLLYEGIERRNPSSEKFVGITCKELSPRLSVYGIDVFDYRIWIFITLLVMLFYMGRMLGFFG